MLNGLERKTSIWAYGTNRFFVIRTAKGMRRVFWTIYHRVYTMRKGDDKPSEQALDFTAMDPLNYRRSA